MQSTSKLYENISICSKNFPQKSSLSNYLRITLDEDRLPITIPCTKSNNKAQDAVKY